MENQRRKQGKKNKNKPKPKPKPKPKQKTHTSKQNKQVSENKRLKEEKKQKAEALIAQVKQEGRAKFRDILGIMNTIRSNVIKDQIINEEVFDKLLKVSRKSSHINLHLENEKGMSLVKKHGKQDVSYPAGDVNSFSGRLINVLFSFGDDK